MGERGETASFGTPLADAELLRVTGAIGIELEPSDFSLRLQGDVGSWLGEPAERFREPGVLLSLLDQVSRRDLVSTLRDVMHDGVPREVTLRVAGANEGAEFWLRLGRSSSGRRACGVAIERGRADSTDRAAFERVDAERERSGRRLRAHDAMSRLLAGAQTLAQVAPDIAREVCLTLGWKYGAIWMYDGRIRRLVCVDGWTAPGFTATPTFSCITQHSFADGEGVLGRVRSEGRSIWIPDVRREPRFMRAEEVLSARLRGAVAVPIRCDREVCGVLELLGDEVRRPDPSMLRLLEAIGVQLGQYIAHQLSARLAKESEVRRRAVLEGSLESIWIVDEMGRVLDLNPAAERLFGYRREEALGRNLDELIIPERDREGVRERLRQFRTTRSLEQFGRTTEQVAMRRDRTELPIARIVLPIALDGEWELIVCIQDLSEQKRATDELRFQKYLLEAEHEASPDGILVVDRTGVVLSCNQRFLEIWGLAGQVISKRLDRAILKDAIPLLPDPERFFDRVAWLYAHPEARGLDEIALNDGRTLERYTCPIGSREGEFFGRVWFFNDVTVRKRAEQRERLIAQEQTARTMAEEGQRRTAFLANASNVLFATLDYDTLLQLAAHVPLGELADWTVLDVVEEMKLRRAAAVHLDPELEPRLRALRDQPVPEHGSGIAQVLRERGPQLFSEVDSDSLGSNGPLGPLPPAVAAEVREIGIRSCMVVPVLLRDELFGVLTLVSAREGMRYSNADLQLAAELAHRLAVALEHARLYGEAQKSIRARDEFLSIASHELRTPLTSLQLAVQSAVRHFKPDVRSPEQIERLQRALLTAGKQAQRLTRLIDAMLDASRAQSGRLDLELSQVDLSALVREVVAVYMEDLVAAGCELTLDVPEGVVGLWDRGRLEQVITNLLSNAMKYGAGKPIEISVGRQGDLATLAVTDHGIGIDPVKRERIFERFVRAVSGPRYSGLGLGLYIVRRIVDASGGTVEVESKVGDGSTFRVLLPVNGPPFERSGDGAGQALH